MKDVWHAAKDIRSRAALVLAIISRPEDFPGRNLQEEAEGLRFEIGILTDRLEDATFGARCRTCNAIIEGMRQR